MALWIVFAVLTAVTILAVAAPLFKGASGDDKEAAERGPASDEEVYRAQLEELEAERTQGLLGAAEYAAARVEISRRLLLAAQAKPQTAPQRDARGRTARRPFLTPKGVAYLVVLALPASSLALYLHYGAPDLPGQPLQARISGPMENQTVDALIFQVEQRLRQHPEDGVGWSVVAPVYLKMGRYEDAADAYDRAIRLRGETGARLVGRGEALVFAAQGAVTPEAKAVFSRALEIDSNQFIASFWLAMGFEQEGKWDRAASIYRETLQKNPPDEVRRSVMERLQAGEARSKQQPAAPQTAAADRGPTAADVQAAQQMTDADRSAMISQMVERLATRLDQNGADLSGWLKLVRAYSVLGRKDDALKALSSARRNFTGNTEALGQIDELARSLGLSS